MNVDNVQRMVGHYDRKANLDRDANEAIQERAEGPALPLKEFHNHIKRQLLVKFAFQKERLLDLCCGRGGDLHKWKDAQVRYVKGLDISPMEIEEAKKRYVELQKKMEMSNKLNKGMARRQMMVAEFEAVDCLGQRDWQDAASPEPSFDAVTCMFALQYFFDCEQTVRQFIKTVADNIKPGGYFFGTVTNGLRVLELLRGRKEYREEMLCLSRKWADEPAYFGSSFVCALEDTVVSSGEGSEGSIEFLVHFNCLEDICNEHGLFAVTDYEDAHLQRCFLDEDRVAPFKRFKPFFRDSHESLEHASSLYAAFAFQKVDSQELVTKVVGGTCTPHITRLSKRFSQAKRKRVGGPYPPPPPQQQQHPPPPPRSSYGQQQHGQHPHHQHHQSNRHHQPYDSHHQGPAYPQQGYGNSAHEQYTAPPYPPVYGNEPYTYGEDDGRKRRKTR